MDEGRCAAVMGTGFHWEPGVLDSVDPGELESPDPDVRVPEGAIPVEAALACAGVGDPRCAPLHTSDAPTSPHVGASGPDLFVVDALSRFAGRAPVLVDAFGRASLLGAGRDAASELMRPPRG